MSYKCHGFINLEDEAVLESHLFLQYGGMIPIPGNLDYHLFSQSAFTCLKLTIETLEQVVKYVQS